MSKLVDLENHFGKWSGVKKEIKKVHTAVFPNKKNFFDKLNNPRHGFDEREDEQLLVLTVSMLCIEQGTNTFVVLDYVKIITYLELTNTKDTNKFLMDSVMDGREVLYKKAIPLVKEQVCAPQDKIEVPIKYIWAN